MGEEPQLRKKHLAHDRHKNKKLLYSNKHIRINESIRRGMVHPNFTKNTSKQ